MYTTTLEYHIECSDKSTHRDGEKGYSTTKLQQHKPPPHSLMTSLPNDHTHTCSIRSSSPLLNCINSLADLISTVPLVSVAAASKGQEYTATFAFST